MSSAAARVLVVRAAHQSDRLSGRLRAAGLDPVVVPVIEMLPPLHPGVLRDALADPVGYHWVAFTSSNAVAAVDVLPASTDSGGLRLAAVGPGTAEAMRLRGWPVDLMPDATTAEGLVAAFAACAPGRVLLPLAEGARPTLEEGLIAAGWTVTRVTAYRTVPRVPTAVELQQAAQCSAVLFTSSSSVTAWLDVAREFTPAAVISIGPQTSATAHANGLHVDAEATEHHLAGLVAATLAHLAVAKGDEAR